MRTLPLMGGTFLELRVAFDLFFEGWIPEALEVQG